MHHMTKKSLQARFRSAIEGGASPIEVKNAITQAEPTLTPEEVDEIVLSLCDEQTAKEDAGDQTPADHQPAASTQAPDAGEIHPMLKGKKKYDIWRGKWHPRKAVTGLDGQDVVIEWEFMKDGKAVKTGVPMEPEKAELFNVGKHLRAGNTFTEQMIEVGYAGRIMDILPNPFTPREINL
jgi:hypothetical protein